MNRVFLDGALREWEAYATTARGGLPEPGRIAFRPLTDGDRRTRVLEIEGNRAAAEARVARASHEELRALLEEAAPLP